MKNFRLVLTGALVVLAGLVIYFTWQPDLKIGTGSLERIRKNGSIRIGYAVEAPYIFFDESGRLAGLEYDTAQMIASRLGFARVEWVQTDFSMLIQDLLADRFDLISAGLFITTERSLQVNFSEPVFHVRQALLVPAGNPQGLHSYEDVRDHPQVKVAVLDGAIEQTILQKLGVPAERMVKTPDALTGRVAVESGVADCLALSSPTVQAMAMQQVMGTAEIAEPFSQPALSGAELYGYGAAAFRKEDGSLLTAWNKELAKFVGSPDHLAILVKYGFSSQDLPGNITTQNIISTGTP